MMGSMKAGKTWVSVVLMWLEMKTTGPSTRRRWSRPEMWKRAPQRSMMPRISHEPRTQAASSKRSRLARDRSRRMAKEWRM